MGTLNEERRVGELDTYRILKSKEMANSIPDQFLQVDEYGLKSIVRE